MYKHKLSELPSDPNNYSAVAELLDGMADKQIKGFVALMEMISSINESGDEASMDALFADMERFNEVMRKSLGKK